EAAWAGFTVQTTVPATATFTLAEPLTVPAVAVTVARASAIGAAYCPVGVIAPALAVHVNVGWVASATANWSDSTAENCWAAEGTIACAAGATLMLVAVAVTVTVTALVVVRP